MFKGLNKAIVLFDGYCNLCSGSVVFILKRERGDVFRFASLQSDFANQLLTNRGLGKETPRSIIVVENDRLLFRSTAALHIVKQLRGLWPTLYILILLPKFIRDPVYDFIARNRYKWFGMRNRCFVPDQQMSFKFLD